MKKYIFGLMSLLVLTLVSCSEEEGAELGSDSNPCVTIYQLPVSMPLNADNDACVRVYANNKVSETYYKVFTEDEYASVKDDSNLGEQIKNSGTKVELESDKVYGGTCGDVVIKGIKGTVVIAIAGVSGSKTSVKTLNFKGLEWETICAGTYYFASNFAGLNAWFSEPKEAELQMCSNEEGLYRIKDVFGEGYSHKFYSTGITDEDKDGSFEYIYTPGSPTPYTYSSYGEISVRDVYMWQGENTDYLVDQMYDDGTIYFWSQYYVSAGSLGYAWESFVPNE